MRIDLQSKEKKLATLLYNAIGYMLEDMLNDDSVTCSEACENIADYLGTDVDTLVELEVLDYDEIVSNDNMEDEEEDD